MDAHDMTVPRRPQVNLDKIYSHLYGRFIGRERVLRNPIMSTAVRHDIDIPVLRQGQCLDALSLRAGAVNRRNAQKTDKEI
jgi:hypothetical protein